MAATSLSYGIFVLHFEVRNVGFNLLVIINYPLSIIH